MIVTSLVFVSFAVERAGAHPTGKLRPHVCAAPDVQHCGAIYAGQIGSDRLYIQAARAETGTWDEAAAFCAKLGDRWHLPTRAELAALWAWKPEGVPASPRHGAWHWSSSLIDLGGQSLAWAQNLTGGQAGYASLGNRFAATCVRLEPRQEEPPTNDRL